jgi:hypothetical protein
MLDLKVPTEGCTRLSGKTIEEITFAYYPSPKSSSNVAQTLSSSGSTTSSSVMGGPKLSS